MVRVQIQFTEEQLDALRARANQHNRSVAEVVRECVDQYVAKPQSKDRKAMIERALRAAGSFASGKSDISERHDDYLADAFL